MARNALFLFVLLPLFAEAQNCEKFKTINKESIGSILIRDSNSQEEIVDRLGVHIKYDLIWIDECTYILFNGNIIEGGHQYEGNKTDTLRGQITATKGRWYEYRATCNYNEFVSEGKVRVQLEQGRGWLSKG